MVDRRRLTHLLTHPAEGAQAVARRIRRLGAPPCLVCGSRNTSVRNVQRPERDHDIRVCHTCGYLSNFANSVDYAKFSSVKRFTMKARVGTATHQGREFHMAEMGTRILGRRGLTVMVFGAGASLDYQHIGRLPEVKRVVMADVVDLRDEPDFVNITEGTSERFDLIIACEVIEHFPDPRTEFSRLFKLLKRNGLLVCSTNVYDGGNFAKHGYLYSRGHVSYYSPRAIGVIARRHRMRHDFRLPAIALGGPGPRKRYVLFTRSGRIARRWVEYFGTVPLAPSESTDVET